MARKRIRRGMRPVALSESVRVARSGLERSSCSWKDAIGPGYATGVTQGLAQMMTSLDSERYCR